MHIPLTILVIFIIVALVIVAVADWLALLVFGLRTTKVSLAKIIGVEMLFTAVVSLITMTLPAVSLLLFVVNAVLWAFLLKHYIAAKYSVGRAIGSYLISYVFVLGFSLMAAIFTIGSVIQTFDINGESMAPALHNNDKVLVYKFEKKPSDNSVIIYRLNTGKDVLGRVHGTPGQAVSISASQVVVTGQIENIKSYTLRANQYYVTVDNALYNIPARIIDSNAIVGTIGPKL